MSLELQLYTNRRMAREEFQKSLYLTAKILCGFNEVNWRTHGDMIENLESGTRRKLVVMPRGTFKSSIGVVAYSVWILINNPNARILIDSEKYANSKNFIREIKAKLESPLVTELFGDARGPVWGEGEMTVAWRTQALKEASVTASGVESNKVGQHYNFLIFDDLNTSSNSNTPEACEKVLNHYRLSISILEPDGTICVIGTRYSAADVIGHILENEIGNGNE